MTLFQKFVRGGLWRFEVGVFVAVWFLLMILGRTKLLQDPGSLWHTVVGERILESGQLIYADPFSFTRGGQPWVAQQWLAECIMALAHRMAGLDGLVLLTASLLALFFSWLAYRIVRQGTDPLLATLLIALTALASTFHFHARPHLASIIFMAVTLAALLDFETGRISLRKLYWLIPVYILWANTHGGFLGGIAMMVFAVSGWLFLHIAGRPSPIHNHREAFLLGCLVFLCALTAFVNPYGLEIPRTWLSIVNASDLSQYIDEHRAPGLRTIMLALPICLVYLVVLLGTPGRYRGIVALIPLIWLALGLTKIRHVPLFTVTALIVSAEMFPYATWREWLSKRGSELCRIKPVVRGKMFPALIVPATLVCVSILIQASGIHLPVFGKGWAKLDRENSPIELLPELKRIEKANPPGTPIFNDMLYGGFLIYYAPGLRIFIDDRCELYGSEGLMAYKATMQNPTEIDRWRREYGFRYALVQIDTSFDEYLNQSRYWRPIKKTSSAALYEYDRNGSVAN